MLDEKVTGVQRAIDDWIRPSTRASTRVDLKDLARLLDMLAAVDPAYGRSLAPQDVLDHFAAGHISDGDCGAIEDGVLRDTRRRIEDIWDQL